MRRENKNSPYGKKGKDAREDHTLLEAHHLEHGSLNGPLTTWRRVVASGKAVLWHGRRWSQLALGYSTQTPALTRSLPQSISGWWVRKFRRSISRACAKRLSERCAWAVHTRLHSRIHTLTTTKSKSPPHGVDGWNRRCVRVTAVLERCARGKINRVNHRGC